MNTPHATPPVAPAATAALALFWQRLCHGEPAAARARDAAPAELICRPVTPAILAAAAVRVARCIFDNLAAQQILLIGSSPRIAPYADGFCASGPRRVTVIAQRDGQARELAHRIGGRTVRLPDLPEQLPQHDIVVSCTASVLPILGKGMVERTMRWRHHRPLLIIDLATHQDVEPEVAELDDVYLYATADLARFAEAHCELLRAAVSGRGPGLMPPPPLRR